LEGFLARLGLASPGRFAFNGAWGFGGVFSIRLRTLSSKESAMARQPLPIKYHKGPWRIGHGVIETRPKILQWIGTCAARWSFVEHQQAILLGFLMEANTDVAVSVFASLRTAPVRRSALQAAAQVRLDAKSLELFEAILSVLRKVEGHRNDIVHGHWGVVDAIADGAIWIPSQDHSQWNTEILVSEAKGIKPASNHGDLARKMYLYKEDDLEDIATEIMISWRILFDLVVMIRESDLDKREKLYRRISDVRLVREELVRIRARQK
jgi:hypothetical protein